MHRGGVRTSVFAGIIRTRTECHRKRTHLSHVLTLTNNTHKSRENKPIHTTTGTDCRCHHHPDDATTTDPPHTRRGRCGAPQREPLRRIPRRVWGAAGSRNGAGRAAPPRRGGGRRRGARFAFLHRVRDGDSPEQQQGSTIVEWDNATRWPVTVHLMMDQQQQQRGVRQQQQQPQIWSTATTVDPFTSTVHWAQLGQLFVVTIAAAAADPNDHETPRKQLWILGAYRIWNSLPSGSPHCILVEEAAADDDVATDGNPSQASFFLENLLADDDTRQDALTVAAAALDPAAGGQRVNPKTLTTLSQIVDNLLQHPGRPQVSDPSTEQSGGAQGRDCLVLGCAAAAAHSRFPRDGRSLDSYRRGAGCGCRPKCGNHGLGCPPRTTTSHCSNAPRSCCKGCRPAPHPTLSPSWHHANRGSIPPTTPGCETALSFVPPTSAGPAPSAAPFEAVVVQIHAFREQVKLACELQMPLFLHERNAHEDLLRVLDEVQADDAISSPLPPIVVHCFTGTHEEAQNYLKRGYFIGFTGIICKKERGAHLRDLVLPDIPLDRIMIETDAPFMSFIKGKGRRQRHSEPAHVVGVAKQLSSTLDISLEQVCSVTTETATKFFRLDT